MSYITEVFDGDRVLFTVTDLKWLVATHLPHLEESFTQTFVAAVLTGNEDCPQMIDLYSEDRYDAAFLRFQLIDGGAYRCVGICSKYGRG